MNDIMNHKLNINVSNAQVLGKYPSMEITLDELPIEVWYRANASKDSVEIMEIKSTYAKLSHEDWYWITSQIKQIESIVVKEINNVEQDFDDIGD